MKTGKSCLSVVVVLLSLAAPARAADTLAFFRRANAVVTHDRKALETLVPAETVKVFEFHEEGERSFRAINLKSLLDKVYGESWRKEDDMIFRCADGYEPVIPVSEIVSREPFLAIDTADSKPFTFITKPPKKPEPMAYGPYYLTWKNIGNATLLAEGDRSYPYQVVAIDLVRFADRYPKLAPPVHSSKSVKEGFALYRKNCINCHTLNGEGSTAAAMELNRPVSVARYWRRDWLVQWIENPSKVRETAKMPPYLSSTTHPLPPVESRRQVEKIVQYLEAMAKN